MAGLGKGIDLETPRARLPCSFTFTRTVSAFCSGCSCTCSPGCEVKGCAGSRSRGSAASTVWSELVTRQLSSDPAGCGDAVQAWQVWDANTPADLFSLSLGLTFLLLFSCHVKKVTFLQYWQRKSGINKKHCFNPRTNISICFLLGL